MIVKILRSLWLAHVTITADRQTSRHFEEILLTKFVDQITPTIQLNQQNALVFFSIYLIV